ncbi:hypothetical protein [Curtobacterium sp. MCSS17_016]|uniref:hypothetical protein n=1 Tax=Curtobacterium sp. MCSS17_016 TaxID=2175644 RepID=UPI0011B585FF|nr:hypothetical protein [Curtobacterium sp. MCSS17_016]WIE81083.1 hypothetical protein DEJ19_021640 [Curtobacterium sp. MCSS17_016]
METIPPVGRQRKPRRERRTAAITIGLPVVGAADAPVAYRVPSEFTDDVAEAREFREYDGALYWSTPFYDTSATAEQRLGQVATRISEETHLSKEHAEQEAANRLRDTIVIDGTVWEKTTPPGYQVRTHGQPGSKDSKTTIGYALEGADKYGEPWFPAGAAGHGSAVHAALELAVERGDTGSMDSITSVRPIDVPQPAPQRNMWNDPEFLLGHLDDLRTDIADRRYEGRDQPEVMQTLFDQRADVVRRLQDAGVEVPRP